MKINWAEESGYSYRMVDVKVYVRENLIAAKASEVYYEFVKENSYRPISDLLPLADASLLQAWILGDKKEPLELLTVLSNRIDSVRNVLLRIDTSELTEQSAPLYEVTINDPRNLEARIVYQERQLSKYRHFMSVEDVYYFEYTQKDDRLVGFKYLNEAAFKIIDVTLEDFATISEKERGFFPSKPADIQTFITHLRGMSPSFEISYVAGVGEEQNCILRGGRLSKDRDMVAGVLNFDAQLDKEAYYLKPSARDAGTGLLNKRAITEYCLERLAQQDGELRWLILLDIDDFKSINDTYGHLCGDQVIRTVAELLESAVGHRGMTGRFGGDEFFVIIEKPTSHATLKIMLKALAKELALSFDPKFRVTASMGVSAYPQDGTTYEELMRKADKALYIAKEKGKNRHIIYDEKKHGALDEDDMLSMSTAHAQAREKRGEMMTELITGLCTQGVASFTNSSKLLEQMRTYFALDGITIFSQEGRKLVCRSGDYEGEAPNGAEAFLDPEYMDLFGESGIYVETNIKRLETICPRAYEIASSQNIGATIQCISRKDDLPYAMVNFDVLGTNRKWSEEDVERLSIIGRTLGQLLCMA